MQEEATVPFSSYIKLEDTVLLKASHGMDFSKIAEKMKKIFKK